MLAQLTPLWIGLALLALLLLGAHFLSGDRKKTQARLARVTRTQPNGAAISQTAHSLRRHDPSQDSAFAQMLASMRSISKLQARLEVAGMDTTPQKFLGIAAAIALVVILLVHVLLGKALLIALLLGILAGLGLPHFAVSRAIGKRQKKFLLLFPDAIELMVRGLRSGLPIAESFITVSKEVPPPVAETFLRISQQTALGVPMERALTLAAQNLGLPEFNFFVTGIILQRETGGNLGEILSNLAEMLRGRQMMRLKIHALSSEARASAYIVGALPFFVFGMLEVISPAYLSPLFNDYRGNLSLAAAAFSMTIGGLIMRKMTQLEI